MSRDKNRLWIIRFVDRKRKRLKNWLWPLRRMIRRGNSWRLRLGRRQWYQWWFNLAMHIMMDGRRLYALQCRLMVMNFARTNDR